MLTVQEIAQFSDSDGIFSIRLPWSRGDYTYSTNGHLIIRIPRHPDIKEILEAPDALNIFLKAEPIPSEWIDIPALPEPQFIQCKECDGQRFVTWKTDWNEYEAECKSCDGTGESGEIRKIEINGVIFNVEYLRKISKLPNFKISVLNAGDGIVEKEKPVWFKFDGGDGLIMPCRF